MSRPFAAVFPPLLAPLLVACMISGHHDAGGDDPSTSSASKVTLPTFSGDCTAYFDDEANPHTFDWSKQTFTAQNCSSLDHPCVTLKNAGDPVGILFRIWLPQSSVGTTIPMTSSDLHFEIDVARMGFGEDASRRDGDTKGTLTIRRFDVAGETIELELRGVRLMGKLAEYTTTGRCAIDGIFTIEGLAKSPVGSRCSQDYECGNVYSGRVCDDDAFVCKEGCHADSDCPPLKACDHAKAACIDHPGAFAGEIEGCEKACHDVAGLDCGMDESRCTGRCSSAPRDVVNRFATCAEAEWGRCADVAPCIASFL